MRFVILLVIVMLAFGQVFPPSSSSGSGGVAGELVTTDFASLAGIANGSQRFCSDCTVTSGVDNTCAGSGTGALAIRLNGAWKCFQ